MISSNASPHARRASAEKIAYRPDARVKHAAASHRPWSWKLLKLLLLVLSGLLVWGLISFAFSSIPLRRIRVEGLTRYDQAEVLTTAGLSNVDKLLAVEKEQAERALLDFYPYIKSVRVRYAFPFGIRMDIVEEEPVYYTRIADDYFALSADLKVLEKATSARRFAAQDLQQITLGELTGAMLGETITYDGDYLDQVLRDIGGSELAQRITNVHIGDRYHLSVVCDGLYTLYLGDITAIEAKLQIAALMLQDARIPEGYPATLDVSNLKKTSIRYDSKPDSALSAEE